VSLRPGCMNPGHPPAILSTSPTLRRIAYGTTPTRRRRPHSLVGSKRSFLAFDEDRSEVLVMSHGAVERLRISPDEGEPRLLDRDEVLSRTVRRPQRDEVQRWIAERVVGLETRRIILSKFLSLFSRFIPFTYRRASRREAGSRRQRCRSPRRGVPRTPKERNERE